MKRILPIALTACILIGGFSLPAAADSESTALSPYSSYEGEEDIIGGSFVIENGVLKEYKGTSKVVTIPNTVKKIGESVFENSNITSVTIPSSVEMIGRNAFYKCESLKTVNISEGLTTIDERAFAYCSQLESITLPDSVTAIKRFAFSYCDNLKKVDVGSGLDEIGQGVFMACFSLESIEFPDSIHEIGIGVFGWCSSLKSVYLGKTVKTLDISLFLFCKSLKTVNIPKSVERINQRAFYGCSALTELYIPSSVTYMERESVSNCENLEKLVLSSNLTTIEENAFIDDPKLTLYVYKDTPALALILETGLPYVVIDYYPEAVTGLSAVNAGKNRVKLSWNRIPDAQGYLVYGKKNGKYGYVGMTTKGTTFTDTKALDTDYNYYWVFAYRKDGDEMIVGTCEKYVFAKGVTTAVTNLKANGTSGKVTLTWSASEGADGYLIYGIRPGEKYGYIGMTTKGTTFSDTKASKTDWTFYWVFPYHNNGGKMIVGGTAKYVYSKAR